MFSRKEQLDRKTGPYGVGRYEFLKQLINEFTTTRLHEAKRQTLANLTNFAYDPVNFEYLKQLHVVDLFLAQLSEGEEDILLFAVAGLCNLSADPEFCDYIISLNGVYLLSSLLNHSNLEICLNTLATLYLLSLTDNVSTGINKSVLDKIKTFEHSDDKRLRNLSQAYLKKWQKQ